MKVYKFGGASVRDAAGIRNLEGIIAKEKGELVIVVSAFGKTTNALEKVLQSWISGSDDHQELLHDLFMKHKNVIADLDIDLSLTSEKLDAAFNMLRDFLTTEKRSDYDYVYDQVVSFGELWSTIIVAGYLEKCSINAVWIDIRESLLTDSTYRNANVLWDESAREIKSVFNFRNNKIYVTQGFIGGTAEGHTTTLGREGSDYTAALLANMLDADHAVVWKDVPGILNADPDWLPDAVKLDEISYKEAVEMTFSGAKVIHPKTIKPLHNKNIPLHVRSFINPSGKGTIIKADAQMKRVLPVFIRKEEQILISILPKDFSFVMGENLGMIFKAFMTHGIKVNLVEASAISLDVCVDDERVKVNKLIEDLSSDYMAVYNEDMEMITVRHYTEEALELITSGRDIMLEQRTRSTARYVIRKL